MTDRKPGYYFFRFASRDSMVRFWDGSKWFYAQCGQETGFTSAHAIEERFLAEPLTWDKHVYYGDPYDETVYADRYPHEGDELCDGHQIHYEWRNGKWR
jgi:hypothetical protein